MNATNPYVRAAGNDGSDQSSASLVAPARARWIIAGTATAAVCVAQLLVGSAPANAVGANPWGCGATVDRPHASHTNPHAVNVHADLTCRRRVPSYSIRISLYRSRWWGWEKIGGTGYKSGMNKAKARAVANWEPHGACHHYKAVGEFVIAGGSRRITSTVYNFDTGYLREQDELCVK